MNDMIVYLEIPMESTKGKPSVKINLARLYVYKVNVQKIKGISVMNKWEIKI